LLLSFAGCGRAWREAEPNEHFTQASPLPAGGKVAGTIGSPGDVDVYRLSLARDGAVLNLHLGGIRDVDFTLSVQDKDRRELKRYDETALGGDEQALDIGLRRGDYYVVVANKNPKSDNPKQEYALTVGLEPPDDHELEPNDRPLAANALPANSLLRGHYFPAQNLLAEGEDQSEEDWYRVTVDREGLFILNVDLSEVPKVDPVLEVYDANAYKIKEVDNGGPGEPESLRRFGVKGPAQLSLRLRTKPARSGNAEVAYQLLTELLPYEGKEEFEPNDQRLDATPFERDSIGGGISPAGDADWYRVMAPGEGRHILRADLSALAGMDLQLVVTDELGNPLAVVDNMGKEQPELLTGLGVTNGTYYLVVSEKTGKAADARGAYALTKSLTPFQEGLEYETSGGSRIVQAVKVGQSVDGYLAPKGDVDWYEFNVYQKGRVVFELTGLLGVRFGLALFDQEERPLQELVAKKPGESLSFDRELEAGTYRLRLRAEDPGQNNVRDKYTLRLRVF
jgi:hypothetical protein